MPQPDHRGRRKRLAPRGWRLGLAVVFFLLLCVALIGPPTRIGLADPAELARRDMRRLGAALDLLRSDIGRYPTAAEGLSLLVTPPPQDAAIWQHWQGPYLKGDRLLQDPWRQPYHYSPVDTDPAAFTLYSDGPLGTHASEIIRYSPGD